MSILQKTTYLTIITLILLTVPEKIKGQDPVFSQYYASPLQINPSFTVLTNGPRFGVNYRNQWPLIDQVFKTYVTYNLFYDQFIPAIKSGFGLELTADDAGAGFLKTYKINGLYGYKIPVNRRGHVIKGGLELGYAQVNYAWDKFVFGDQIDPVTGYISGGGTIVSKEKVPLQTSSGYLDAGAGVLYYCPLYYIGASVKHFNAPGVGILAAQADGGSSLPPRFTFHGGFELHTSGNKYDKSNILSPSFIYIRQSSFSQFNIGAQYLFSSIFGGIHYRHANKNPDAVIFNVGIRKGFWRIGYSFDLTISDLSLAQGGTHELSLIYAMPGNPKKTSVVSDCFEAFR